MRCFHVSWVLLYDLIIPALHPNMYQRRHTACDVTVLLVSQFAHSNAREGSDKGPARGRRDGRSGEVRDGGTTPTKTQVRYN